VIGAAPLDWETIEGEYSVGACGVSANARNIAHIAHLIFQGGVWDAGSRPRPVISASRVASLTSPAPLLANPPAR
jgi:hypothetical protein